MSQDSTNLPATIPGSADKKSVDLVRYMRQQGFGPAEIELIEAYASPDVICRSARAYKDYLLAKRGVDIPYDKVRKLLKDPKFQECVNLLYAQEKGAALRAVEKTLFYRATNPADSHGVAAARLIMQANGMLGGDSDKPGAGAVETQFAELIMQVREGKVQGVLSTPRRRIRIEAETLHEEEDEDDVSNSDGDVVDGSFSITAADQEERLPETRIVESGDDEDDRWLFDEEAEAEEEEV